MFLEICLAIILGMTAGVFTGLIPGLHVNLIAAVVVSSVGGLLVGVAPFLVAVFIISLALTHSFLDSIPSIYLGAPDESQVVATLPGHQYLRKGLGHQAILYTLFGSLFSLFLILLFFPIGLKVLKPIYIFIQPFVGKFLLVVVIILIILSRKIFLNTMFFLFAGLLGFLSFSLVSQEQILLPLLSGLFGTSTLLISLFGMSSLPKQHIREKLKLSWSALERNVSRATVVGFLASFLPGFGSSQAAIVASTTMKKKEPLDYLLLVGGINTVNFAFSLVTLFILGKARNGAIVSVKEILGELTFQQFLIFIPILFIVAGIATLLGIVLSKGFSQVVQKVNYHKLIYGVVSFLFLIVFLLSKWQGILILLTATALGIMAGLFGAQKNMLLGCLLLPVIFYLW